MDGLPNGCFAKRMVSFWMVCLVAHAQDPLEGLSELRIEDGVDDGVDTGVDVA